jgi:hypothetical protein
VLHGCLWVLFLTLCVCAKTGVAGTVSSKGIRGDPQLDHSMIFHKKVQSCPPQHAHRPALPGCTAHLRTVLAYAAPSVLYRTGMPLQLFRKGPWMST